MLPKILDNKAYIEITNPIHGGEDWRLGTRLWTSERSKNGGRPWKILESINPGDIIIHLVKDNHNGGSKKYHAWVGISMANSRKVIADTVPPERDITKDHGPPYQKVELINFISLKKPYPIADFFQKFYADLKQIRESNQGEGNFFAFFEKTNKFQVAQKYVEVCSEDVYALFDKIANDLNFHPIFNTDNTLTATDSDKDIILGPPGKTNVIVYRFVRDSALVRELKKAHQHQCQICGLKIQLPNNNYYIEAHHLIPLGNGHDGIDSKTNMILLCPTHHAEFDYGSIAINPTTLEVEHINSENGFHGKKCFYHRQDLDHRSIEYHYSKRFRNVGLFV